MKGFEKAAIAALLMSVGLGATQPGFSMPLGSFKPAPLAIGQTSPSFNGTPRYTDPGNIGIDTAAPTNVASGAGDVYSVPGTYAPSGSAAAAPLPSPYASQAPISEPPSAYTAPGAAYSTPPSASSNFGAAPGSITPFASSTPSYGAPTAGSNYGRANPAYTTPAYGGGQGAELPGGLRGPATGYQDQGIGSYVAPGSQVNPSAIPVADTTGLPPHTTKHGGGSDGPVGATLGLTDRAAKSSVGLSDQAAKASVGLADRAAKTGIGAPVKLLKSIF